MLIMFFICTYIVIIIFSLLAW